MCVLHVINLYIAHAGLSIIKIRKCNNRFECPLIVVPDCMSSTAVFIDMQRTCIARMSPPSPMQRRFDEDRVLHRRD